MENHDVQLFIQQQKETGITLGGIREKLLKSGWTEESISVAFEKFATVNPEKTEDTPADETASKKPAAIILSLVLIFLIICASYLIYQMFIGKQKHISLSVTERKKIVVSNAGSTQSESDKTTTVADKKGTVTTTSKSSGWVNSKTGEEAIDPEGRTQEELLEEYFVKKQIITKNLKTCTPIKVTFTGILDKKNIYMEILGKEGEICKYREEMVEGSGINCNLTNQQIPKLVEFDMTPTEQRPQESPWTAALLDKSCVMDK